jgi:glycosyltransferase involved in cell wall biosynthesis
VSGVSVLILTLNEELNLGECIDSCAWSDDIVVFDSMSTDRTQEIARAKGVRVVERAFDNYAAQRNAALTTVAYKNPWVLMVDADERIPDELAAEVVATTSRVGSDVALFRVRRKDFFMGKWLRRSSGYPSWFGRLMRVGHVRVEREVNEEYVTDGRVEHLHAHLHHFPFNKGVAYWFERHNRYSSMEAMAKVDLQRHPVALRCIFSHDPVIRRRALKHLAFRLPLRPPIIFLYLYFVRFGLFDGWAGFYFSGMRAIYELLIDLKAVEIRRRQQGVSV